MGYNVITPKNEGRDGVPMVVPIWCWFRRLSVWIFWGLSWFWWTSFWVSRHLADSFSSHGDMSDNKFWWKWMCVLNENIQLGRAGVIKWDPFWRDQTISNFMVGFMDFRYNSALFLPNYSDLTRPHPKWWFSKGNPLIPGKPTLVKGGGPMGRELGEIS